MRRSLWNRSSRAAGAFTAARQFFALAGLAATELLRQPVCFLLIVASVALTVALPMATSIQLGQQTRLARDSALAFEFIFGLLLGAYAASSTLSRECRSGTVMTVLSKPVSRGVFFAAKFAAVAALLCLFVIDTTSAALIGERLTPVFFEIDRLGLKVVGLLPLIAFLPAALGNLRHGHPFVSRSHGWLAGALLIGVILLGCVDREGHRVAFGSQLDWRLVTACALEGLALLLLTAMALSLATRFSTAPTVAILTTVLFAGLLADYIAGLCQATPSVSFAVRSLLPDLQAFWPADRLGGNGGISLRALGHAAAYAALYSAGVLALGYAAFRQRQF